MAAFDLCLKFLFNNSLNRNEETTDAKNHIISSFSETITIAHKLSVMILLFFIKLFSYQMKSLSDFLILSTE